MASLRSYALTALCLTLAIPAAADEPSAPQPSALERARSLLAEKKPDEALALVDPIIVAAEAGEAKDPKAMCPGVAASFFVAMMAQGQRGLNLTATVENDWCEAMLVKGYALGELQRFGEAASILGKLVPHDSGNANYLAEYGFALRSAGQIDQALDAYKRAKSVAGRYTNPAAKRHWRAVALRGIGYIAFDRAQWDDAEKAYRDSLKDEPGNEIALHELEQIRQRRAQ